MSKRFAYPPPSPEKLTDFLVDDSVFVFNKWLEVVDTDADGNPIASEPDEPKVWKPGPITHQASQAFADAIYDEIHAGYGFTPLLGAGFSVSAGIPIINQLKTYLQRCICVALGVEQDETKDNKRQLWNPRTDRWPPLIDRARPEKSDGTNQTQWNDLMWKHLNSELEKREKGDPSANPAIFQEAYGAMAEWRTSLFFISRIVFDRKRERIENPKDSSQYSDPPLRPRLEEPSQSVIDAGWREWMRNKRPTLNHRMLATLSGLLRIDTILTTNFDDFIERAFEQSRNPLQTFDVRLMDGLPERELVMRARSIVKMHGSTRSLRADYSLDGEPSAEDKGLFAEYLAGDDLRPQRISDKTFPPVTKKHLFISGVGATEHRTVSFITHALETLSSDLKVFWVCYTEDDVHAVIEYAKHLPAKAKQDACQRPRIYVIRHTEIALLLLHIYQSVRRTLPPENALYPAVTQLSFPPLPRYPEPTVPPGSSKPSKLAKFQKALIEHIKKSPLTIATSPDKVDGVTTICEKVFREFEARYVCMWIEMNDIHSIDELFEIIQETAYYKLGQRDWTPLYAADDDRPRDLEVERIADSSSKPFLIFINAREKPGSNRTFDDPSPNAWLDNKEGNLDQLDHLLHDLKNSRSDAFKIVLLAHDSQSPLVTRLQRFVGNTIVLEHDTPDNTSQVIEDTIQWVNDPPENNEPHRDGALTFREGKLYFLHTLALMQRARHLSICWARCAMQPNDNYWSIFDEYRPQWLQHLEKKGLIRRKDGGFVWMHSHLRERLRAEFINQPNLLECEDRAKIQRDIALWYLKQFDSTGTPPAIFEAVDHLCFSAAHLIVGAVGNLDKNLHDKAIDNLLLATKRVKTSCELLREHRWLIHTQGYPRASSRRLEYVSDFWLVKQWMTAKLDPNERKSALFLLDKIKSEELVGLLASRAELMNAIAALQQEAAYIGLMVAREIGEARKAYQLLHVFSQRLMQNIEQYNGDIIAKIPKKQDKPLNFRVHEFLYLEQESCKQGPQRHHWMNWWFLCGLLGIASRSYNEAEQSLFRALQIVTEKSISMPAELEPLPPKPRDTLRHNIYWNRLLKKLKFDFSPMQGEQRPSDPYLVYSQALEVMEQAAYLLILRANTAEREVSLIQVDKSSWFHIGTDQYQPPNDPDHNEAEVQRLTVKLQGLRDEYDKRHPQLQLRIAEKIALKALILIEQIQDSGIDRPDQDHYLMGTKSRLLQIAALSSRYKPTRKSWSRHAMSLMGDASAALSEAQPIFAQAEHAIIDIRRAEIRLHEAATKKLYGKYAFEAWTHDRLQGNRIVDAIQQNTDNISQLKVAQKLQEWWNDRATVDVEEPAEDSAQQLRSDLREITSRATDAIRFLERAEPILRDRRRNVSWTTRYFDMRLRAIAMILWASVVQKEKPIPYLGLEAAMRRAETEPDQLLKDAVRMIRVDSYRLAMVILAYASCARALQIRLALDQAAVRLPDRLEEMKNNLDHAVRQLETVRDRRQLKDQPDPRAAEKARVNDVVERVVEETIKRVRSVLIGLAEPV